MSLQTNKNQAAESQAAIAAAPNYGATKISCANFQKPPKKELIYKNRTGAENKIKQAANHIFNISKHI